MGKSKEIKQSWTRAKNFEIWFCVIFGCYDQNFVSGRETGHPFFRFSRYFLVP